MWIKLTNESNKHPILINSNRVCSVIKHNAKDVSVVCFSEDDFFLVVETVEEISAMLGIGDVKPNLAERNPLLCNTELDTRLVTLLQSIGIDDVSALIQFGEKRLRKELPGMSTKTINEIKKWIGFGDGQWL